MASTIRTALPMRAHSTRTPPRQKLTCLYHTLTYGPAALPSAAAPSNTQLDPSPVRRGIPKPSRCITRTQRRTAMGGHLANLNRVTKNREKATYTDIFQETGSFRGRNLSEDTQAHELVVRGTLPDNMPLFPGTLIMPKYTTLWKELWREHDRKWPTIKFVRRVLYTHRLHIWRKIQDSYSLLHYWKYGLGWPGWTGRSSWKGMTINRRGTRNAGISLYSQMNNAIWGNDQKLLDKVCVHETARQLRTRTSQAAANGQYRYWTLVRTLSSPRTVSHRAVPQEFDDGSGFPILFRQAIIRMHSIQRLVPHTSGTDQEMSEVETFVGPDGETTTRTKGVKEVEIDEYMVIQKRFYKGKEEDWKAWGTVSEATSLDEWEEMYNPDPLAGAKSKTEIANAANR